MNKIFDCTIYFDAVEIRISAKNKTEAKKKLMDRISKKNPKSFIAREYPSNRKQIYINEYE